jgi:uncharacterized protein (TIGR03382 family)
MTAYAAGYGWASAVHGGSANYSGGGIELWETLTNDTPYVQFLSFDITTSASVSAYSSSWNATGLEYGSVTVDDSDRLVTQSATAFAYVAGANSFGVPVGDAWSYTNSYYYSGGPGFGDHVSDSASYGSIYPFTTDTLTSLTSNSEGGFDIYPYAFLPYSSDTFYIEAYEYHYDSATTPGPTSVAPFAIGVLSALRRRRRKQPG